MNPELNHPGEGLSTENFMREVGAKVLNQAGFRGSHEQIVDSSFEKSRKTGEKLVGKNDERRVDAYLERLNRGIEKYGTDYENRLWRMTEDSLIIDADNIPESYWKTQEQILRDNGQGRELGDYEKSVLAEDIQKKQRESLESWTNYLSHEDCPYPTWFKVYTIDGVSKMGVFDKGKNVYRKRDKDSVAPYPHFNAAVLGKVYSAITDFYDINTDRDLGRTEPNNPEDENAIKRKAELDALVKSGNFNKLYSKLLLSEKVIMKTPERTEDIRGEWVEYSLGDEEQLAEAADGTPWCIASPAVGRNYLTTGHYGESYDDDGKNNEAKFILFHLYDSDGRIADNACASVRLDTDGQVAEISGLNEGQALEDSLVPIVEEKVRSLPGGEKFLRRFADKNRLIAIDRKIQSGADISKDDFRFIWELDRPIESLDTYNSTDPRIKEFREKFGADYAREKGYIIPDTTIDDVEGNLEKYLENDLDLKSNLLVYCIKKALKSPERTRALFSSAGFKEKAEKEGMSYASRFGERLRNLETYATKNYIFMLPKDVWSEDKIKLPNPENNSDTPEFIAPNDLTAVLKQPVDYDWNYETDGRRTDSPVPVYGEKWVGREIKHFPWSKELFEAEAALLKPNGYHIPGSKEWRQIYDNLRAKYGDNDRAISTTLREDLNLAFSGCVWKGDLEDAGSRGCFWSSSEYSADSARCLGFDSDSVGPESWSYRDDAYSVRCVSESGSFPNS